MHVGGGTNPLPLRLVGVQTPKGYGFFLTNLPPRIGPRQVADLSRVRGEVELSIKLDKAVHRVNVRSGARLSRFYLPQMLPRNWGQIVFISSESGVNIPVEMVNYGVTKTAQIALAHGLAEATAGTGVTVNSVLPGPTRSEGVVRSIV